MTQGRQIVVQRGFEPEMRSAEHGFTLLEMLVALAVFSLAALALVRLQGVTLRTAAAPALHRLLMRTGAVVHLGAVDRGDIVHLDKLGGSAAERVPTAVGARAPAHRVALGIAALAAMSPEEVETALEQGGSGFRPGPRWWAELHRVRDGVVVRDGDHTAGMRQPDREQQRRRARAGRGMVHRVTVLPRGGSQGNQAVAGRLA